MHRASLQLATTVTKGALQQQGRQAARRLGEQFNAAHVRNKAGEIATEMAVDFLVGQIDTNSRAPDGAGMHMSRNSPLSAALGLASIARGGLSQYEKSQQYSGACRERARQAQQYIQSLDSATEAPLTAFKGSLQSPVAPGFMDDRLSRDLFATTLLEDRAVQAAATIEVQALSPEEQKTFMTEVNAALGIEGQDSQHSISTDPLNVDMERVRMASTPEPKGNTPNSGPDQSTPDGPSPPKAKL